MLMSALVGFRSVLHMSLSLRRRRNSALPSPVHLISITVMSLRHDTSLTGLQTKVSPIASFKSRDCISLSPKPALTFEKLSTMSA